MYQYGNGGVIRFPRNYSTMNESIALRQHIITNAYNQRFSTGSNPPLPEDVAQFYKEIAEKINRSATDLHNINEEVKASWTNEPFDKPVNAVVYVPISTKFATAHGDGKVRYWQSMNGNQLYQMRGHQGPVNCLAAHPTKEIVASGGNDGTVRVWLFVGTGAQILKFQLPGDPPPPVRSLAFLPGGNTLVAGSDDGTLRRYDLRRGEEQCHTLTYAGPTTSMSADPLVPGKIAIGTGSGSAMVYH
jgi:WD40 repeat protein